MLTAGCSCAGRTPPGSRCCDGAISTALQDQSEIELWANFCIHILCQKVRGFHFHPSHRGDSTFPCPCSFCRGYRAIALKLLNWQPPRPKSQAVVHMENTLVQVHTLWNSLADPALAALRLHPVATDLI